MSQIPEKTARVQVSLKDAEMFRNGLLAWFDAAQRDLPWRRTKDPYSILVSEMMLQQTRVAAVIPYYHRFLARFPAFGQLAEAAEAEVLTYWAGLGYYSRARCLQKAAQAMCDKGGFPETYVGISALPGVGDYTAAAVASIAFNLPHPAVDGNVLRVLTRWTANGVDIASLTGKRLITALAAQLLDQDRPGAFNQACMELGATICLPRNPQCLLCPVANGCRARQEGRQNEFPVKLGRSQTRYEERQLLWIEDLGKLLLWKRSSEARLMPGFWELPERTQLPDVVFGKLLGTFRHGITVHSYLFDVFEAASPDQLGDCQWVDVAEMNDMPLSTIVRKARQVISRSSGQANPKLGRRKVAAAR